MEPTGSNTRDTAITFVAAVNDEEVFRLNVLASPVFAAGHRHEILARRGYPSAGLAYNDALGLAKNDIVVFLHQDVYLPDKWDERLIGDIEQLESSGCNWGVLGCFGISIEGQPAGHVYSNGLNSELGGACRPVPAQSLDEMVLIFRKSRGLRFDPALRHFHLYGTDICLEAGKRGYRNFVVCNFCVHNSLPVRRLPSEFWRCVSYLVLKWKSRLPVKTCCIMLLPSIFRMQLMRFRLELWFSRKNVSGHPRKRLPRPFEVAGRSGVPGNSIQPYGQEYVQ